MTETVEQKTTEMTTAPASLSRGTLIAIENYIRTWFRPIEPKVTPEAQKIYDQWFAREQELTQLENKKRAAEQELQKAEEARQHLLMQQQAREIKTHLDQEWELTSLRYRQLFPHETKPIDPAGLKRQETLLKEIDVRRGAEQLLYQHQMELLKQALARYQAAANKTNAFYKYVNDHMQEGFSPDEWSILTAGITFRGMPTSGDLMYKDVILRNAGIHSANLARNFEEEIGTGRPGEDPSHAQLLFDSLKMLQRHLPGKTGTPGEIPMVDDIATHGLIEQLLLFRKEGIHFDKIAEVPKSWKDFWYDLQCMEGYRPRHMTRPHEEFDMLCSKRGIVLPHAVRSASAHRHLERAGKGINMLEGTTTWKKRPEPKTSWNPLALNLHEGPPHPDFDPKDPAIPGWYDWHNGVKEFILAQHIVGLLPDESFLDYGIGTRKNQHANPNNPYDGEFALCQVFDLMAREGNGKGHVDAQLALVKNYLGYIPTHAARKLALKWGKIHVEEDKKGVEIGVEKDHAALSLDMVLTILHSHNLFRGGSDGHHAYGKLEAIKAATNALNFVVDRGYFKVQHDHMQHVVDAMQLARDKAKAEGVAFIMPRPEQPAKEGWVNAVMDVSNGVRRTGRGLSQ